MPRMDKDEAYDKFNDYIEELIEEESLIDFYDNEATRKQKKYIRKQYPEEFEGIPEENEPEESIPEENEPEQTPEQQRRGSRLRSLFRRLLGQ